VKVYDALAEAFVAEGTTDVFELMGDANMHWLNALHRLGVRLHHVRHEGAGLAMADGWARVRGAPGVCSTTSGPGTTQLATTLVVASRARTPLVAFCGDVDRGDTTNAQHFDQQRFAEATECGFVRLWTANAAKVTVRDAFCRARSESRPIMLSVPTDLQEEEFEGSSAYQPSATIANGAAAHIDPTQVSRAAAIVADSARPVLLVGRGAMHAGAGEVVRRLAERIGALVATTLMAKNWLDDDPFQIGIAGGYGTKTARELIREADCVVVAGASVSSYTTDGGELVRGARVVQFDTRPQIVMGDGRSADCYVQADARSGLEALEVELAATDFHATGFRTPAVAEQLASAWEDPQHYDLEPGTLDPREACLTLDRLIPEDIGLVLGSGQQVRFGTMLLRRPRPFIVAQHHFGCIGQGLTTAMGAVIATGRPAFLLEGDGGFMMHLAEFETAVRDGLPLLVLVMNDRALGAEMHKSAQIRLDPELTLISTPDLGAVGRALGGHGHLARTLTELEAAVAEFVGDPAPTLVDVRISRTVLSIPYRRAYLSADV
jgi:acetolactate synthase-1/2/3 large subunit